MINQLLLVGKIKKMPIIESMKDDNELIIEVRRNYKNVNGVYEKDCFKCYLWLAISRKITVTCKEGDVVAIKGRLVNDNDSCRILAEQVVLVGKINDKEANVI